MGPWLRLERDGVPIHVTEGGTLASHVTLYLLSALAYLSLVLSAKREREIHATRKHTRLHAGVSLGGAGVLAGRFFYGLSDTVFPEATALLWMASNKRDDPVLDPISNPRSGGNQRGRSQSNLRRSNARWSFPASSRIQGGRAQAVSYRSRGTQSRRTNDGPTYVTVKIRCAQHLKEDARR